MNTYSGQIAIFMALLFHVFFIFFAMVVNVGLLVHHKINLQNSVDLAAYYSAMKQAEAFNVLAHTNYQLRQSWKLLNFRYRAYGLAGNEEAKLPIYCYKSNSTNPGCTINPPLNNNPEDFYNPSCITSFCHNYSPWEHMTENENSCKSAGCGEFSSIPLAGIPNAANFAGALVGLNLGGVSAAAIALGIQAVEGQRTSCHRQSLQNWLLLASFIYSYKWDMVNRKALIHGVSQGLSQSESDFLDIDGLSVREGALKTLEGNLTEPNLQSFKKDPTQFRLTNSLGKGICAQVSGGNKGTPYWLQPIYVRPLYRFSDKKCDRSSDRNTIDTKFFYFSDSFMDPTEAQDASIRIPPNMNSIRISISEDLFNLIQLVSFEPPEFSSPEQNFFASTVGYEKNPWCMAYVTVEAETSPKIPFSPFGSVKLKAQATAKPFGGNIGPWYAKQWPPGAQVSGGSSTPFSSKTDPHLTFRADKDIVDHHRSVQTRVLEDHSNPEVVRDFEYLIPSHSRYLGDPSGTKAYSTMQAWINGIYNLGFSQTLAPEAFNNLDWIQMMQSSPLTGDILPWRQRELFGNTNPQTPPTPPGQQSDPGTNNNSNFANNVAPHSRKLEIEAILPDQFDVSYYSIELDFFNQYIPRLRANTFLINGFLNQYNSPELAVRGDLGYRKDGSWTFDGETYNLAQFSIANQFSVAEKNRHIISNPESGLNHPPIHNHRIFGLGYQIRNPNQQEGKVNPLLTFWHMAKPGDYTFKDNRFGRCPVPMKLNEGRGTSTPAIEATPGRCIAGGRSGYSVKLVDPEFLKEPQALGDSSTTARILNPPEDLDL
jgi:hypothetical protein